MVAAVVAGVLIGPGATTAQQPHPAAIGDLMTALVQPRHIKLGVAGSNQNWAYAAYELDQLRETFADLADILPTTGQSRLRTATSSVWPTGN